jgi:hypothetical protein
MTFRAVHTLHGQPPVPATCLHSPSKVIWRDRQEAWTTWT